MIKSTTTQRCLVACAFAVLLTTASAARADVPADGPAKLKVAIQAVAARFQADQPKGTPPRLSNPEDKAALDMMWDSAAILGTAPYGAKDVPSLLDILKYQNIVLKGYTFFAMKAVDEARQRDNEVKYQDEIFRSRAVLTGLMADAQQAIGVFLLSLKPEQVNEARKEGLARMELGNRQMVDENTKLLAMPGIEAANKTRLVEAMAAGAPILAANSPPVDRDSFVASAKAALSALPDADKPRMQAFVDAMATKTCEGVCAFKAR